MREEEVIVLVMQGLSQALRRTLRDRGPPSVTQVRGYNTFKAVYEVLYLCVCVCVRVPVFVSTAAATLDDYPQSALNCDILGLAV